MGRAVRTIEHGIWNPRSLDEPFAQQKGDEDAVTRNEGDELEREERELGIVVPPWRVQRRVVLGVLQTLALSPLKRSPDHGGGDILQQVEPKSERKQGERVRQGTGWELTD